MRHHVSLFSQMLALIPRVRFASLVRKHGSERHSKGFSSWQQLVAMLFCQLAQAKSLREICQGLRTCLGKLNHLGLEAAPKRATLSYANAHRPWELFRDLFYDVLATCRGAAPGKKRKFRFKNRLLSLDATVIELCQSIFDWAKFTRTKGAVKLHLLLDHDGYLPVFAHISNGREHEIKTARMLRLPEGSIVAIDRGYVDCALFEAWSRAGVWFVTRCKKNMRFGVVGEKEPPQNRNIICDQLIHLTAQKAQEECPRLLRRVVVWDPERGRPLPLLTNHLDFGASTIAEVYRDRWQIELFFKALKQNLKVKTFVGTSANALRIQTWTALISMLLIKYLQFRSKLGWALSNLVALLRWNLFSYRDLWEWIDDPFNTPPEPAKLRQIPLAFLDSILAVDRRISPGGG
jgi:hypothetical protein